ncbi:MAG: hypothetical protein GY760_26540 [Deltaproteobacteria bacterium]|nr:hypothetical protein [Deltaproteobacteria bacterium]
MSYTYEITTAGKALIAKAQTGTTINFTKAKLGKGDLLQNESPLEFTDLKEAEATEVNILYKEYLSETGNVRITLTYSNEGLVTGYYVKEVGLFANDPDVGEILFLYCYSSDADYLPPDSLDPIFVEPVINLIIKVDNATDVTANILPSSNVVRADYAENSILKADTVNDPTTLTVDEDRIVGRKTGGKIDDLTSSEVRDMLDVATKQEVIDLSKIIRASVPGAYEREKFFKANGGRSLTIFANTLVNINGNGYVVKEDIEVTYSQSIAIAGKDLYLYACVPTSGDLQVPELILSNNSTFPSGYTADTARKIGGCHCICENIAVGDPNWPEGMQAGDFLPTSFWDLDFRAMAKDGNEGMVYDDRLGKWVDIYKPSKVSVPLPPYQDIDGNTLTYKFVSRYNGDVALGEYPETMRQGLGLGGKKNLTEREYTLSAEGSPEQAEINRYCKYVPTGCNMEKNYGGGILHHRSFTVANQVQRYTHVNGYNKVMYLGNPNTLADTTAFQNFGVEGVRRGSAGTDPTQEYCYECIKLPHKEIVKNSYDNIERVWNYNKYSEMAFIQYQSKGSDTNDRIYHPFGTEAAFLLIRNITQNTPWIFFNRTLNSIESAGVFTLGSTDAGRSNTSVQNNRSDYLRLGTSVTGNVGDLLQIQALFTPTAPVNTHESKNEYMYVNVLDHTNTNKAQYNVGFEPDYILLKRADGDHPWHEYRKKRGWKKKLYIETGDTIEADTTTLYEVTDQHVKLNQPDGKYMMIAYKEDWKTYSSRIEFGGTDSTSAVVQKVFNGIDTVNNPDTEVLVMNRSKEVDHFRFMSSDRLGIGNYLRTTNGTSGGFPGVSANLVREFTSTGFNVGGHSEWSNGSEFINFSFKTDEKVTASDGIPWNINRKLGFAWCIYQGTDGSNRTISNPSGRTPKFITFRPTNAMAQSWHTWFEGVTPGYSCQMDTSNAISNSGYFPSSSQPTSSEFTLTGVIGNTANKFYFLMMFFEPEEAGTSKVFLSPSEHTNASDLTVESGVENPEFVMFKCINSGHWMIIDAATNWKTFHYMDLTNASYNRDDFEVTSSGRITIPKALIGAATTKFLFLVISEKSGHFKVNLKGGSGTYVSQTGGFSTTADANTGWRGANRRIVSRSGIEDCVATTWQYTDTSSNHPGDSSYVSGYGLGDLKVGEWNRQYKGLSLIKGGGISDPINRIGTGATSHAWEDLTQVAIVRGICDSSSRKPE